MGKNQSKYETVVSKNETIDLLFKDKDEEVKSKFEIQEEIKKHVQQFLSKRSIVSFYRKPFLSSKKSIDNINNDDYHPELKIKILFDDSLEKCFIQITSKEHLNKSSNEKIKEQMNVFKNEENEYKKELFEKLNNRVNEFIDSGEIYFKSSLNNHKIEEYFNFFNKQEWVPRSEKFLLFYKIRKSL